MEHFDIYISYRREDGTQYARILSQMLKKRGYRVFHDCEELVAGNFADKIRSAIQDTPVFLMILSPHYLNRCKNENDWIRQEIIYAYQYGKYIIPVNPDNLFTGVPSDIPTEIKEAITMRHHASVSFGQLFESSIDKLVDGISNIIKPLQNRKTSYDVFLSYPRFDIESANKLSQTIESNGISVWRDVDGIYAGEQITDKILDAITNAKVFIALYSKWALKSVWFKKELEFAQENNIPIIKVLTDNIDGLSGIRRMSFGSMLEMGSNRFEEKILSCILNNGCKPETKEMFALGKEMYDRSQINNNLADEGTAFSIFLRAAELGNNDALSYVERQAWNIDLKNAALQYISINSYFVQDLCADLYNRGMIIAEDETLTDVAQRGRGMERAAFCLMKRAINLGYEGINPEDYSWYYLEDSDFQGCYKKLGLSSTFGINREAAEHKETGNEATIMDAQTSLNPVSENNTEEDVIYNVFISCKSEDYDFAQPIHDFLIANGLKVFFADAELKEKAESQYADVIDEALDATKHLIVVATSIGHIKSKWVKYEWSTFSNDLKSNYRDGNLITILSPDITPRMLPASLRHMQSFSIENFENILPYVKK